MPSAHVVPFALVLCLSLVACAKSDTSAAGTSTEPAAAAVTKPVAGVATSPARPTACSIVGQEDMSRILGGAVGPPESDDRGGTTKCTYTPASGEGFSPYAEVTIDWEGGEAAMLGMRMANNVMGRDAGFSLSEKIPGVGDEASMMVGNQMSVRQGEAYIGIDLAMQPDAKDKGVAIAKAILAHIDTGVAQ